MMTIFWIAIRTMLITPPIRENSLSTLSCVWYVSSSLCSLHGDSLFGVSVAGEPQMREDCLHRELSRFFRFFFTPLELCSRIF
jgi:hypothetical protein